MVAVNDRVKETTTTTGQGTVDLGGAKTGFETFVERIGDGNQTYYCIAAEGGAEFEVGIGTVTNATPDTLSRDTVLSNSDNNTNKVTFGSGTKEVFCTLPASKAVLEDAANNMNVGGSIIVGGTVDGVDIAARDTVLTATVTTANAALPKAGGTMSGNLVMSSANITMSGTETVDGVDISARDAVLTSTTTTANAALPKAGGTMTGNIVFNSGQPKGNSGLVPAAGTSGHFLAHNGAFAQIAYSSLSGTPTIPSNNNQLTNGAGYVTSSGVTSVATGNGCTGGTFTSSGTVSMSGSYSGSFSASSNITAYSSDERLKDFKGKIDNALDKVDKLNGYYFEWNDVAKGLDGGRSFKEGMEVGVSAQEIEKVLPEVVTEAPIVKIENLDTDYKTVYYDKIVPLLIEAIKELNEKLDKKLCKCKD
mgnify:CR=1 FL=1